MPRTPPSLPYGRPTAICCCCATCTGSTAPCSPESRIRAGRPRASALPGTRGVPRVPSQTLPADPRCRTGRQRGGCPGCAERERLRATPQYALPLGSGHCPCARASARTCAARSGVEPARSAVAARSRSRSAPTRACGATGARPIAARRRAAAALSSISLRFPHFGDCTHEGQPSRQRQSPTTRAALATSSGKRSCPR